MIKEKIFFKAIVFIFIIVVTAPSYSTVITTHSAFVQDPHLSPGYTRLHIQNILKKKNITIDHPNQEGYEVYGDEGLFKTLNELKIPYSKIKDEDYLFSTDLVDRYKGFPRFKEFEKSLKESVNQNPEYLTLKSIGKSVEGRDLWLVVISNNSKSRPKKNIFYAGNIHGNEVVGRDLLLKFIQDFSNSKINRNFRSVLDEVNFHILPSINPDGFEKLKRSNANGVDLNRNFPGVHDKNISRDKREPEVIAVMDYYEQYDFSLSANLHGGSEVINYPWDSLKKPYKYDEQMRQLSLKYVSDGALYMQSNRFPSGTINGYEWYSIDGGLQDWSCDTHNSPHITIELSNSKWPQYSDVDYYYENNKESLLNYAKAASSFEY